MLDTSNGKKLEGTVRRNMPGGKVQVWMHEWRRYFVFDSAGLTRLGRFKLLSTSREDS